MISVYTAVSVCYIICISYLQLFSLTLAAINQNSSTMRQDEV